MSQRIKAETYFVETDGQKFEVQIVSRDGQLFAIVGGEELQLEGLAKSRDRLQRLLVDGKPAAFGKTYSAGGWDIVLEGATYACSVKDERAARYASIVRKEVGLRAQVIKAPMPGLIVTVAAKVGDEVKKDQSLLTLSAMKLENDIRATAAGVVTEVAVEPHQAVEKGQKLVVIEPCR